jgi:hypothetical protein
VNRPEDVRIVQELLNKHLYLLSQPLTVDGRVGSATIAAIEAFQQRVVNLRQPDGRVDPGGRTFTALASGASVTPPAPVSGLPAVRGGVRLTEADWQRAANTLRCELACVKAVAEVESSGSGFLASGRPTILFEAHIFSRRTQGVHDARHPDISSPHWNRSLYKGGEREYERLEKAMTLNRQAALESASWGRFQIMGFNHHSVGFPSVDAFVEAIFESEGRHLDAFVSFLQHERLDILLRDKHWADFARQYNGAGYAANQYDVKLAAAYERHRQQPQA